MVDSDLDCPTIVATFTPEDIFSKVRQHLEKFKGFKKSMTDEELCVFAYGHYYGKSVVGDEAQASPRGYYKRWKEDKQLPYFIGSWFNEARRCGVQ